MASSFFKAAVIGILLASLFVVMGSAAPGDTQIRKPTTSVDLEDAGDETNNPENATDFPRVYDQNTSSETNEPSKNPSINWTTWNTSGVKPYEALSLSITVNTSGFGVTNEWGVYYENRSGEVCDQDTSRQLVAQTGTNYDQIRNFTAPLPIDQVLSLLQVCIWGSSSIAGGTIWMWDIRTNGTIETTNPLWRNQQQNVSTILKGQAVELAAQGNDSRNLSHATLATNETGVWENKTGNYSSPTNLYTQNEWTWSNFTWDNKSVTAGSTVGWKIWYNDTAGNHNATDTMTFSLEPPFLAVNLTNPPSPFTAVQNATFTLNASVTCRNGDCGKVNATARYNASSTEPDTLIPEAAGSQPFHTVNKENNITCATELLQDETCYASWEINATGTAGSTWAVDVNFSATTLDTVAWNDTDDAEINMVEKVVEVLLRWQTIDFGELFVGTTNNPAVNNSDNAYNVTVTDSSSVNTDLWINATDLEQEDGNNVIGVSNMTWNTTMNTAETPLSYTFQPFRRNVAPGTNTTMFYWLDMPLGIAADNYTGTLWVKANETS